jgi:hypothetical protein
MLATKQSRRTNRLSNKPATSKECDLFLGIPFVVAVSIANRFFPLLTIGFGGMGIGDGRGGKRVWKGLIEWGGGGQIV